VAPGADHDDLPLPPDTGWGTEVRELMRDHGYAFGEASALIPHQRK
jgi:hypothetical protein